MVFLVILWYDAITAFWFGAPGSRHFGVGAGSLVLLVNIILLSGYTLSWHSLRHIVGGNVDCFSCAVAGGPRPSAWRGVSFLHERHMLFAWLSLFSVGLAAFYGRLVASGAITATRPLSAPPQ